MNIPMIDTLEISFDIINYDSKFEHFINELENKKLESQNLRKDGHTTKAYIKIDKEDFEVLPNGSSNHAYIIHSSSFELKFAKARATTESFYPVFVKIKSKALWSKSPEGACLGIYDIFNWINSNYIDGDEDFEFRERIKRVDLCCHTDKFYLDDIQVKGLQGRYNKNVTYRDNKEIETYNLGSRSNPVYCRIYNKSKEILKGKVWFIDIWEKKNINPNKVWNIEFELHRELLKDAKITTTDDLFNSIKSLWKYCTQEWVVHKELTNTRIERCPVSKEWERIQNAFNSYKGEAHIARGEQNEMLADELIPTMIGYFTTIASKLRNMTPRMAYAEIFSRGEEYLKGKLTDYETVINEKRKSC